MTGLNGPCTGRTKEGLFRWGGRGGCREGKLRDIRRGEGEGRKGGEGEEGGKGRGRGEAGAVTELRRNSRAGRETTDKVEGQRRNREAGERTECDCVTNGGGKEVREGRDGEGERGVKVSSFRCCSFKPAGPRPQAKASYPHSRRRRIRAKNSPGRNGKGEGEEREGGGGGRYPRRTKANATSDDDRVAADLCRSFFLFAELLKRRCCGL